MDDNGNNGGGAFFLGFLFGVLVGAIVALLYTPQSGEKTRFLIQEKGIELRTQVEERLPTQASDIVEEVESKLEEAEAKLEEATDSEA